MAHQFVHLNQPTDYNGCVRVVSGLLAVYWVRQRMHYANVARPFAATVLTVMHNPHL